jgi:hypothetical protein
MYIHTTLLNRMEDLHKGRRIFDPNCARGKLRSMWYPTYTDESRHNFALCMFRRNEWECDVQTNTFNNEYRISLQVAFTVKKITPHLSCRGSPLRKTADDVARSPNVHEVGLLCRHRRNFTGFALYIFVVV